MSSHRQPDPVSVTAKRLTDAELAAEFHRACYEFKVAHDMADLIPCPETWSDLDRDTGWMYAMDRFATLPHYDEVAA